MTTGNIKLDAEVMAMARSEGSYITLRQDISRGVLEINCTTERVNDGTVDKLLASLERYNQSYVRHFPGDLAEPGSGGGEAYQ